MSESEYQDLLEDLKFQIERSVRYHERRRSFFESWHKFIMLLVILSGSAAFSPLLNQASWLGLFIAFIAAMDLVLGFSHKARDHSILYMRFIDLLVEMESKFDRVGENLSSWTSRRLAIEKDEPPVLTALNASCHNEVIAAQGLDADETVPLTEFQSLFMHYFRFDEMDRRTRGERRKVAQ